MPLNNAQARVVVGNAAASITQLYMMIVRHNHNQKPNPIRIIRLSVPRFHPSISELK